MDVCSKMKHRKLDQRAVRADYLKRLSPCLYIPIAARNIDAIEEYVGDIVSPLTRHAPFGAVSVAAHQPESPDLRLPLWHLPQSAVLHSDLQVWVDVNYRGYRAAYARAFADTKLSNAVLDHVLNRRLARLKGFKYLRIVPISRATNSSHGGLSEKWAVDHYIKHQKNIHSLESAVQYADIADITKMLDIGGRGSFMDGVNHVHELAKPQVGD